MYTTGFCNTGAHEGTMKVSPSGKPMRACTAIEVCECPCHVRIGKMYSQMDMVREIQSNPDYKPAENVDLSGLWEEADAIRSSGDGGGNTHTEPVERPSVEAPGLVESARSFTLTDAGYRARGQLEAQVQKVANNYMLGVVSELMTPKAISRLIDPIYPPSTGAIGAVLERWEKIGYARVSHKPIVFRGLTPLGMEHGLEKLKAAHKRGAPVR